VQSLTLSGAPCNDPLITSYFEEGTASVTTKSGFAPGAQRYSIVVPFSAAGTCVVQSELQDGRQLQNAFKVTRNAGCCETYSVDNDTWDIDASPDAG